jgi:hypothetical protein
MAAETEEQLQVDDTPEGQARRWALEFQAARKEVKEFHDQGDTAIKAYLDERTDATEDDHHVNLYASNMQTIAAIMYGKTPKVDCARRYADSADDAARVSAEVLERVLNLDIETGGDCYTDALASCLDDRLKPGLGIARLRYEVEWGETPAKEPLMDEEGFEKAPAVPSRKVKKQEKVEVEYVYWKDFLWSVSRTWKDVRWVAFRYQMSRKALEKRFPKYGKDVPLNSKQGGAAGDVVDALKNTPWGRADIWEVWSKEDGGTYWVCEGFDKCLDFQEDPYQLEGFFPCPRPMVANVTTSRFVPKPDYALHRDLYDNYNLINMRIALLVQALQVRGLYDATAGEEVGRLLKEAGLNELIPIKNWPLLIEKGGIAGIIQWMPLEQIVNALAVLVQQRQVQQALIGQITGFSDIIRGQAETQTTATEQSIKAKYASVRLQAFQDEFARFASDLARIKAELISKHFDAQTLMEMANVAYTPDAQNPQLVQQAVQLIKSDHYAYRVEVKPESVNLTDYAALKQERTEVMAAVAGYIQTAGPLAASTPQLAPALLQLLQWLVSGIRGSQEVEGILDQAIVVAQQAAQNPPPQQQQGPDPKLQAAQMKGQMDLQKEHLKGQMGLAQIQAQTQADLQHQVQQTKFNIIEAQAKERAKTLAGIDASLHPAGTTGGGVP